MTKKTEASRNPIPYPRKSIVCCMVQYAINERRADQRKQTTSKKPR
ncbi:MULTISPECIES: hypothetical protein [Vibrio]|nr:hypothetical protein [Vibrio parahaemolyticus]ELC9583475.1 hypothetical protein [Vibrio vulnificus]MBX5338959.1 hypothetical protein [Vibrio parahaemolyticus]HCH1895917.1 hypothetical protein [Vibrio parahaemolyticus]